MVGVLRRALASRSPKSRAPLLSNTVTRPCPSTQLQLRFTFPSSELANTQGWRDEGAHSRSEMGRAEEQELQIPSRSLDWRRRFVGYMGGTGRRRSAGRSGAC